MKKKKLTFKSGDKYDGEVNELDQFHGYGNYYFSNGSYYDGEFSKSKFHGKGTFFDALTKTTIKGEFKNN